MTRPDLRAAAGLLTAVPVQRGGDAVRARASDPGATLSAFPLVGLLVGAAVGAVWLGAGRVWPALVAAAVVVAVDLGLTGLLHLDGLADSGDGLLPPLAPERRLEVMADPHVGAFGVGVVAMVLLVRVASLASVEADLASVVAIVALWVAARSAMAVVLTRVRPARPDGMAAAFAGADPGLLPLAGLVGSVTLAASTGLDGFCAVLAGLGAGVAVVSLARARLGGVTGDVVGAAGIVGETVGLVVLAAQW